MPFWRVITNQSATYARRKALRPASAYPTGAATCAASVNAFFGTMKSKSAVATSEVTPQTIQTVRYPLNDPAVASPPPAAAVAPWKSAIPKTHEATAPPTVLTAVSYTHLRAHET